MRKSRKLAAAVAVSIVTVIGASGEAQSLPQAKNAPSEACVSGLSSQACGSYLKTNQDPRKPKRDQRKQDKRKQDKRKQDHGRPKPPKPPTPPTPPTGCNDIDSAVQGMTKYVGVICNGQVYVLSVNEAGMNPPTPVGGWQPVGGPTNAFDATLAVFDAQLLVSELTSTGEVWQGSCTSTLPLTVPCTFTQMPTPP